MGNEHSSHGSSSKAGAPAPAAPAAVPAPPQPPVKKAASPYMRRDIAEEGREVRVAGSACCPRVFSRRALRPRCPAQLFRKFAQHLDNQAKKAPHLGEAHAATSSDDFGSSRESASFLSRFKFLEVVGAGSYSTVHRAIEKATGRPVAIKVIKKEILSSSVEAQIRNEAVRSVRPWCAAVGSCNDLCACCDAGADEGLQRSKEHRGAH